VGRDPAAGFEKSLHSGIVLTGGGAMLEGMPEIAEQIFDLPIRRGMPGRRRRARRSRQQPGLRHGRRAGHVRAPHRARATGTRRERVLGAFAGCGAAAQPVQEFFMNDTRRTDGPTPVPGRRDEARPGSGWVQWGTNGTSLRQPTKSAALTLAEPSNAGARIKVIGVGGGGSNAVNRMVRAGFEGSSSSSPTPTCRRCSRTPRPVKIQIGAKLTKGLGAGADPNIGRQAALEDTDKLIEALDGADMVFVTTGMGGGTGTGAAPVIASLATELGALTIAVVTKPFKFEGKRRFGRPSAGLDELRDASTRSSRSPTSGCSRSIGRRRTARGAFAAADDVLRQAIQGISDLILVPGSSTSTSPT
jgi:hypothetical protein